MPVCALEGCKEKFEKRAYNQKYCSPEHSQKASNQRRYVGGLKDRTCEVCGEHYTPNATNQKYCSDCKDEGRRQRERVKRSTPPLDMCPVPDGYDVKRATTLYGPDGDVRLQWVRTDQDKEQLERTYQEVFEALREKIPKAKKTSPPKRTEEDLLNLYILTDYHLGMKAWDKETGEDWDADIAENLLVDWYSKAIASSPDAQVGVLAQLGDFLHWDGMTPETPEHGNILDADTRFARLVRVAIRSLRRVIALLLTKHREVRLIAAEGNHDPASSVWLREWLAVLYEDEPRVVVDQSPNPYYCVEHGETSLFFHHGHLRKAKDIDQVFAAQFREVFGRTKFSYGHLGHLHTQQALESNLMLVENHRTLASPDAFASRHGYLSGRGASVISYSRRFGEVGRVTIGPEMCQEAI